VIATAKRLRRASPKTGERRSFRQIADELQSVRHLNERGHPYKHCQHQGHARSQDAEAVGFAARSRLAVGERRMRYVTGRWRRRIGTDVA
jgi:hypothetical protein